MNATANVRDHYADGLEAAANGRHAEAIAAFEQALGETPNDLRVLFALGNAAAEIGHAQAAENFFRRVLERAPDSVEALVNLGNLLRGGGRTADVIALIKPAIERNPQISELWLTLGSALREAGDAKTADTFYREALRLDPGSAAALGNLADLLADNGSVDEALGLYDQALSREPEHAQARLNRAILLFLKGRLRAGWRDYEYRLLIKERVIISDHGLPAWAGRAAEGMRLLITAEQGIGDQIMFASLVPGLLDLCRRASGHLILECEPRLVPLFVRSFAGASVHAAKLQVSGGRKFAFYEWLETAGGADAAVPIGSLPRLLRRELPDFPPAHSYLRADPAEQQQWARWLGAKASGPFVGLCWRSGALGGLRNLQYAPLEAWAEFLRRMPGTPVSLQYDVQQSEIAALQQMSGREILVPPALDQKQEIDRTAALIAALDFVVSAPTSVSWLSAGLGVRTFKILYNTSWTAFGCDYEPFAPAARCIMPDTSGNWPDAFAKAAAAISRLPRAP
jgi:Flp pilus assembly protein TadD